MQPPGTMLIIGLPSSSTLNLQCSASTPNGASRSKPVSLAPGLHSCSCVTACLPMVWHCNTLVGRLALPPSPTEAAALASAKGLLGPTPVYVCILMHILHCGDMIPPSLHALLQHSVRFH